MARGVAQMPVFHDDGDRELLLRLIEFQVRAGTLIVNAFTLMFNHIHLLCETPVGGLGRWMQQILGKYAEEYNRIHDRVGHLWQGRYKAILVQDGGYLIDCSRYVHLNPYRAGIEQEIGSYPWSSYPYFVNGRGVAAWVSTDRILGHFSGRAEYRAFVESGRNAKLANPFELAIAGIALGNEEYTSQIRDLVRGRAFSPEITSQRALLSSERCPGIELIRAQINRHFGDWSSCQRRHALVWALYANTWMKGHQIAQAVGLTPKAAGTAAKETEWRRIADPDVARRFAALQHDLQSTESGHIARIARHFPGSIADYRHRLLRKTC